MVFVRKVANFIYHAPKSKKFIRLTETWHRSMDQIRSELDWMFYLKDCGVNFAHPIMSSNDNYCEQVDLFVVSVFEEAPGSRLLEKADFTDEIIQNWGRVIGKMHRHTKDYEPREGIKKRVNWEGEEYHQNILKLTTPSHGDIYTAFKKVLKEFRKLPVDKDCFGLIHADLHTGNFMVDNGKITAFDFDDCVYHWFIYDIAVFIWALDRFELDQFWLLENIKIGYDEENQLDDFWWELIPLFYNYRMVLIYYFCVKSLEEPSLDSTSREWMIKTTRETMLHFSAKN